MSNAKSVAELIRRQMYGGRRTVIVWSWGVSAFAYGEDAMANMGGYSWPFLRFKVNAHRHKGYVYVYYNEGADTYRVLFKNRKGEEILPRIDECFEDNFVELIDEIIEKQQKYQY